MNIAISIIEFADEYDILILVTADSDQVAAIGLLKQKYPEKTVYTLWTKLKRACASSGQE